MVFLHNDDVEIAGSSPETLVKVVGREVISMPIAGTRRRGKTVEEDLALERELLADEKETAEHNMLVDLGRNDVGRVCDFGTVRVSDYKAIKRFSHVMHITSKVTGQLSEGKDALDALKAVFPAGTLSGAPKIRACEIIDELEPERRGVYGGGMGYLDFGGNMDICITIRTMVKKQDRVYIQAGGGIVFDSVVDNEFQETVNKAGACMTALRKTAEVE
jgi:anthranilate synthase component 1